MIEFDCLGAGAGLRHGGAGSHGQTVQEKFKIRNISQFQVYYRNWWIISQFTLIMLSITFEAHFPDTEPWQSAELDGGGQREDVGG